MNKEDIDIFQKDFDDFRVTLCLNYHQQNKDLIIFGHICQKWLIFFHWFWAHIFNVEKNSNRHEVGIENHNVHHVYALKVTKQNYDSACYKCESSDTVLKSVETAVTKQTAKLDVYVQ